MIYQFIPHNRWGHVYRWCHARLRNERMVRCSCGYGYRRARRAGEES